MATQVLSITQISTYLSSMLDNDTLLQGVALRGEISNYKVYPSGHHYFTLKDEGASIKCVMFRSNAVRLKFRPDNGMKVIAMGKISVYARDGVYQLYCASMILDGIGDLHIAFEQLKEKLSKEGLFAQEHKKPLPKYPQTIGIVTSPAGAAVHDMLRILRKRYPIAKVCILPVRVQGAEAPAEIVSAIAYANKHKLADLLIVGRGGGSIEDLWAFNDEQVARAIYASEIPIISAVGHEPDVTISDFVADLRAATPSNAAELAVPDQDALRQSLDRMSVLMASTLQKQLRSARQRLNILSGSPALQGPNVYIKQRLQRLDMMKMRLVSAQNRMLQRKKERFVSYTSKLDAMSPLKVLTRGYSLLETKDGSVITSVKQVKAGEHIHAFVSDGTIRAVISDTKEKAL